MFKNALNELPSTMNKELSKKYQLNIFWGLISTGILYCLTNSFVVLFFVLGLLFAVKKYQSVICKGEPKLKLDNILCYIVGMLIYFLIR